MRKVVLSVLLASFVPVAAFASVPERSNPAGWTSPAGHEGKTRAQIIAERGRNPLFIRERDGWMCPLLDVLRSPQQVISDRLAAAAAGDIDLLMCSYSWDAAVIMPDGNVAHGREEIMTGFLQMTQMLGGAAPTVTSTTFVDNVVLMTFEAFGPVVSIPDGADTFVIKLGKIKYHTVHATLQFGAAP